MKNKLSLINILNIGWLIILFATIAYIVLDINNIFSTLKQVEKEKIISTIKIEEESLAPLINYKFFAEAKIDAKNFFKKNNLKYLKIKAKEFYSLSGIGSLTRMDCYPYFRELLNKFGTSEVILKQTENIRVCKATVGNFDLFYVYSRDNASYPIDVKLRNKYFNGDDNSIYSIGGTFNIVGNIVIFSVEPKGTMNFYRIKVGKNFYNPLWNKECNYQFPRF